MNRAPATVAISFAASLAFWGCGGRLAYGEMEEPSIVLSQPLGQTIPGAHQTPLTLPQGILRLPSTRPTFPSPAARRRPRRPRSPSTPA